MAKGITWPDAVERRHFAGFPGEYGPGDVVPLAQLGLTEKEAHDRIKQMNLPLKVVDPQEKPARAKDKGGED